MHYMEQYKALRSQPDELVEGAQSIICVISAYNPSTLMHGNAKVARYAYGEDYHEHMKRRLYQMIALLHEQYPEFDARPCVDSAPIAEKLWAANAGLGWIGRNTLLVTPDYGSWVNLGELVTTATVDTYDVPIGKRCGTCHRCVNACPNHALIKGTASEQPDTLYSEYLLDARRCASYHTIENHADSLPPDIKLSGYIFGCDVCQLACPYNQQAAATRTISDERLQQLECLATCDKTTFKHTAKHSPLSRIKYDQLQRNLKQKE